MGTIHMRLGALAAVVVALAPTLAAAADAAQIERGKSAFTYWCAPCHAATTWENGRTLPGTTSLAVKYKGTTIRYLGWNDLWSVNMRDKLPEFEELTGIKVEWEQFPQEQEKVVGELIHGTPLSCQWRSGVCGRSRRRG